MKGPFMSKARSAHIKVGLVVRVKLRNKVRDMRIDYRGLGLERCA